MHTYFNDIKFKKISKIESNKFNNLFLLYLNEITNKRNLKNNYFEYLKKKNTKIFWIKKNTLFVGFFTLYLNKFKKDTLNNIYIRDFYIKTNYRKKKIGSFVVKKIEKIYLRKNFYKMKINIIKANLKVINFWKKLKFKIGKSFLVKKIS